MVKYIVVCFLVGLIAANVAAVSQCTSCQYNSGGVSEVNMLHPTGSTALIPSSTDCKDNPDTVTKTACANANQKCAFVKQTLGSDVVSLYRGCKLTSECDAIDDESRQTVGFSETHVKCGANPLQVSVLAVVGSLVLAVRYLR